MLIKQITACLSGFRSMLRHASASRISAAHGSGYCMFVDLHDLRR